MAIVTPDLETIFPRLERLEGQNHLLKRAVLVLIVLASALLMMAQARPDRVIQAEKFVLTDAAGNVRAELRVDLDGPRLVLFDERKTPRLSLFATEKGAGLGISDETDSIRIFLSTNTEGSFLQFYDKDGQNRLKLIETPEAVALVLQDASARLQGVLAVNAKGVGLQLYDKKGKAIWTAP